MAVLVNDGTVGAAELFADAARSLGGAVLVGEHTAGSADWVETKMLSDGSAVRFTVGTFLDAAGEPIGDLGILPDMQAELTDAQREKLLFGTLKPQKDPQIRAAAAALSAMGAEIGDFVVE